MHMEEGHFIHIKWTLLNKILDTGTGGSQLNDPIVHAGREDGIEFEAFS